MWDRIWQAGRAAWALLGVTAATAVVLVLFWQFRAVFPHLVLAGAIVFVLNPVVTFLQHHGVPRAAGTTLTYMAIVLIVVAIGVLVTPLIQSQSEQLADEWPQLRADVEKWVNDQSERSKEDGWIIEIPNVDEIKDQFGGGTDDAFTTEFDNVVGDAGDALSEAGDDRLAADLDRVSADARSRFPQDEGITEQLTRAREIGTRIFEIGLIFLLGPIIAFYLLVDLPHIREVSEELIPDRAKPQVMLVAHRLNHAIGGYFRGQLAVAFIVGVMVSVGLAIIDLPFWLIVGMIAGFFNMIPLIGPWVGAVPGVIIALTTSDFSTAVWVIVIMTVAQQIDNHFISPLVMRRTTSLHPAVVMVALLAGGILGGFFGLLLAVPLTAGAKVVFGHLWRVYVLEQSLDEVAGVAVADEKPGPIGTLVPGDEPEPAADGSAPDGDAPTLVADVSGADPD